MIFYAKTCLECFQLLHYRKEVNMTYWKVTDNLPKRTANLTPNYWKCIYIFKFLFVFIGLNLKVLFADLGKMKSSL